MRFPPIKPGRGLLWITLRPDETVAKRYTALRAVLKQCRLHPVDTTSAAEIVIVEEVAFRARLDEVLAALGEGDILHLVTTAGERLVVEVIAAPDVLAASPLSRPAGHRPVWLRGAASEDGNHV
jgi:hypothetical protein